MRVYSFISQLLGATLFIAQIFADTSFQVNLAGSSIDHRQYEQVVPEQFFLNQLNFEADVLAEHDELQALSGLLPKTTVSRAQFKEGLERLAKKRKFREAHIIFHQKDAGQEISIKLASFWTIARIQVQGTLIGKDRYRQQYLLEPGDVFDEQKHKLSLEKITQDLASQGYGNAQVSAEFVPDDAMKSFIVTLIIDQRDRFVIKEVEVSIEGNAEDDPASDNKTQKKEVPIESQIRKRVQDALVGGWYTKQSVDEETTKLKDFLLYQGFLDTTIELEQGFCHERAWVKLHFTITLKHKQFFEFHGNRHISKRELLDQIALFGSSAIVIPPLLIAQEIESLYKARGFCDAKVTWKDDGDRLFFFIQEGTPLLIDAVMITGAHAYTSKELVHNFCKPLIKRSYHKIDELDLKQVLEAIGNFYLQQGYWDFAVIGHEYCADSRGGYQLIITIKEGRQRMLARVTFPADIESNSDPLLCTYRHLKKPIPFDVHLIQKMRQVLMKLLQKRGQLYRRPKSECVESKDGIELVWKFDGPTTVVRFGQTIVTGVSRLPTHIITRELAYHKGDIWDQRKIENSVSRLKQLGIFDLISLTPEDFSSQDLTAPEISKTLLLKCIEDAPYEVRARLGMQGVNSNLVKFKFDGISYRAGGSFLVKNPGNKGDRIQLDLDFSRFMHDVIVSYHLPWFFNRPIRTELQGYSSRYDQPVVIGSPEVLYRASQDGFLIGFSRKHQLFETGITCGAELVGITPAGMFCGKDQRERLAQAIKYQASLIDRKIPVLFIEPTCMLSTLDNKIQPTCGYLSLFSLKASYAPTVPRSSFFKILIEQSMFFPIYGPDFVLGLRGRCGTILNADFKDIVPIERFYLGGAYSVRSYEPDHVPPLNPFCDSHGNKRLVPTGGRSMFNMNIEGRFPLYGTLSGVIFTDFGLLSESGYNAVRVNNAVAAAGFGLRLNTVVGPIRFDIGWKLGSRDQIAGLPCERSFAWFLVLGNAF